MAKRTPVVFIVHDADETRSRSQSLVEAAGLQTRVYFDATTFLKEVRADEPGCLVIGARVDSLCAAEVQKALLLRDAALPMIVLASDGDMESAVSALKVGALDVLEARLLQERLLPLVLSALATDLGSRFSRLERDDVRLRYAELTPRECEVLRLVLEGETSNAIAKQLGVREKTIEVYRSHINRKMRVRNAVQLAQVVQGVT